MKKQVIVVLAATMFLLTSCDEETLRSSKPVPEPIITSFYPQTIVGGEPVVIFGQNLGESLTDNYVTLNGEYAEVTHVQHGAVVVRIPMNLPPGDYTIRLTVRGESATATNSCRLIASE